MGRRYGGGETEDVIMEREVRREGSREGCS